MKIEQINAPAQPQVNGAKAEVAMSPRERAIAKLMGSNTPQTQEHPVSNPTKVSPEEFKTVSPSSTQINKPGQNDNNESRISEEPKAETKASEDPISSQYAILARKEKALRQREQQLKVREASLNKPQEQPKEEAKPSFDPSKYVDKSRLTQDPFSVLTELGLTYDQLTEMAMKAPSSENLALMNQIKALEQKISDMDNRTKQTLEKKEVDDRQHAINQISNETKRLVTTDPNFEMIREERAHGQVVKLIEKTFDEDGILLSVEEAAQLVEDHLVERAIRIAKAKKIQQRLAPKETAPAPKTAEESKQPQLKTLTNSVASSRPLSARERALLAFEGKLTK